YSNTTVKSGQTDTKMNYRNVSAKFLSKVWEFFGLSTKDEKKAVCKTCLMEMAYTGGTTNLANHLKRHHGIDPFSKGWLKKDCEPRYTFPCRATFSETIIPSMYETVATQIKVAETENVAWTTDSWTSRATQSYVTITAHFINSDMELCSQVLQTRELPDSHTGQHIGEVLLQAKKEWSCNVSSVTTDNAANRKIAAKVAEIPIHIGCFAHTLNLASGRALDIKEVHSILAKIRSIVSFIHRSTSATALLNKKQKMLQTRWNSSFLMVERFLQQVAILATLTDESFRKQHEAKLAHTAAILGPNEVQQGEQFLKLMEPMYHATVALSGDQSPTVGLIVPLLRKMKEIYAPEKDDTSFQQKVKQAILQDLEKRYTDEGLVHFLEEATVLDPRVKDKAPEEAWQRLQNKVITRTPQLKCPDIETKLNYHPAPPPCSFGMQMRASSPFMSKLVKIYLCTQASSVASERIFSTAGDIVTSTRSCLDPEHVDQLIFLKKNFKNDKNLAAVLLSL
uniref:BED-type domain-containing protein n=1 Tax=Oryzias melastigma TaxID=30732 RepID=A0A3B3CYD9_ORYME